MTLRDEAPPPASVLMARALAAAEDPEAGREDLVQPYAECLQHNLGSAAPCDLTRIDAAIRARWEGALLWVKYQAGKRLQKDKE